MASNADAFVSIARAPGHLREPLAELTGCHRFAERIHIAIRRQLCTQFGLRTQNGLVSSPGVERRTRRLLSIETSVGAADAQQFEVRPTLHDPAVIHHEDHIRGHDG